MQVITEGGIYNIKTYPFYIVFAETRLCGTSPIDPTQYLAETCITARLRELIILWILNCKFNDVQSENKISAFAGKELLKKYNHYCL